MRFDTGLLRQKKLHAQLALFAARNDSGLLTGRKIDSLNQRNPTQRVTETLPHSTKVARFNIHHETVFAELASIHTFVRQLVKMELECIRRVTAKFAPLVVNIGRGGALLLPFQTC